MIKPDETVVVFDLDGTLTVGDTYVAFLLSILIHRPERWLWALILPVAVAAHFMKLKDNAWLKAIFLRVIASGLKRDQLAAYTSPFVDRILAKGLRPQARQNVEKHKLAGHHLILATASFDFYAELIGSKLGFHDSICTMSGWGEDGCLSGALKTANCYGAEKRRRVTDYITLNLNNPYIVVYSDSHADLPLFEFADEPVCVNPTRKLAHIAAARRYQIQDWSRRV